MIYIKNIKNQNWIGKTEKDGKIPEGFIEISEKEYNERYLKIINDLRIEDETE